MDDWKPKLAERVDFTRIDISEEASKVFTFIDGHTSLEELSELSGLPRERVRQIVKNFMDGGALNPDGMPGEALDQDEEATVEGDLDDRSANYRKIYETTLHKLPADQRIAKARTAQEAMLCAFCFDPDPRVIKSVLENQRCGLEHARLIANHHRNPAGLDAVGMRAVFARDEQVRRYLLRNNQASEALLRKVLGPLPLMLVFKLNIGRENTERAKRAARQVLRQKFQQNSAEERAGLIFNSEGRCLNLLLGLTFDSKTAALLCRRNYQSSMLVQNLARFPATPPPVIKHLLKQSLLKRSPHLRKLLLRHPNCPQDNKRGS